MPDGGILPDDIQRDDIAKAGDRTIEAIARRLFDTIFNDPEAPFGSTRRKFVEQLAREMMPVRRIRDRDGDYCVKIEDNWYCLMSEEPDHWQELPHIAVIWDLPPKHPTDYHSINPLYEHPPAGKPALDVNSFARELYAIVAKTIFAGTSFERTANYATETKRDQWEAAIARLMGGDTRGKLQVLPSGCDIRPAHTVAELLAAAIAIVGERHNAYLAAKNWMKVREYTNCLESLYEAMDQAAVKDSEIPF